MTTAWPRPSQATHCGGQSFEVQCAGDGLEAVDAASKSQFDVILMDLQMPGWDGFETAERIRKLAGYRETADYRRDSQLFR